MALDVASSEFYEKGEYVFKKSDGKKRGKNDMVRLYEDWVRQYPIISIDPFAEDDWDGWRMMTAALGKRFSSWATTSSSPTSCGFNAASKAMLLIRF